MASMRHMIIISSFNHKETKTSKSHFQVETTAHSCGVLLIMWRREGDSSAPLWES